MGSVFKAQRKRDGRVVALKVIRSDVDDELEHALKARFRRELEVSKTLAHPYVVKILDGGFLEGRDSAFIVMEYVDGMSLAEKCSFGFELAILKRFFTQAVEALVYIHDMGIIHRDIKPGNIVIDVDGRTVLVDFGLAMSSDLTQITATAERPGTIVTMSPEQLTTGDIDGRSDIYSLGATAYMYAVGQPPYDTEDVFRIAVGITPPLPPRLCDIHPDLPLEWDNLIFKCFSLDRELRFGSAKELLDVIEKLKAGFDTGFTHEEEQAVTSSAQSAVTKKKSKSSEGLNKLVVVMLMLCICVLTLLAGYLVFTSKERKTEPTASEWSQDLANLRKELLSMDALPDDSSLNTVGELVQRAKVLQRLQLTENCPKELIGAYYLASYCAQQKQYTSAKRLYDHLLNNLSENVDNLLVERMTGELLNLKVEMAKMILVPWHDKGPSTNRTKAAQKALSIIRPVVHHVPLVSKWPEACRAYSYALRYIDTNEAKEEAIKFVNYCKEIEVPSENRDRAIMEIVGLLRAHRGFGITSKKEEDLMLAKKLALDVLKRKKEPNERWGIVCTIVDVEGNLGNHAEAEQILNNAVEEMPQFLGTSGFYQLKASTFVHRNDYKNGIATLEKALSLKLNNDERAYINRTLVEWRGYSRLLNR